MTSNSPSKTTNKFSPEVRQRAVRMVLDHEGDHVSIHAPVKERQTRPLQFLPTKGFDPRPREGATQK